MKTSASSFRQLSKTDWAFLLIMAGFLAFNTWELAGRAAKMHAIRRAQTYPFVGLQFSPVKDIIRPFPDRIGYLTDKDLSEILPGMQFAQAQYVLAPAILDLNNTDHRYLLLDYADKKLMRKVTAEHQLVPLRQTRGGVILAANPKAADE